MSFNGVVISKGNGNLGRTNPSTDGVAGLVAGGVAVASLLDLNKVYRLLSLDDAEALGITASYDSTNKVLLYNAIKEFFEFSPSGELFIMVVAQGTTQAQMWTSANAYVKKLVMDELVGRKLRMVGTILNPATGYLPTVTTNIDQDVLDAIPLAQALIDDLATEHIVLEVALIEGRNFGSSPATAATLRDLAKRNISVVIAQDPEVLALDAEYLGTAAMGAALGMLSVRKVNENLGSVDIENKPLAKRANPDYRLSNGIVWNSAVIGNTLVVAELPGTTKADLTNKGYIYVGNYEGYPGVYFNSSPTCVLKSDDYAYIENNRVWGKAARILRTTLIPRIKSNLAKDPSTGFILNTTAKSLESTAKNAIDAQMTANSEVSGVGVYINPEQQVSEDTPLEVKVSLVINDILHEMNITLGLTKTA